MATVNKTETVQLGDHTLPVVPQRHARLRHKLSPEDFERLMSKDYGVESYRVLSVFIPELERTIPIWEWEGYESEEAMNSGRYDEDKDRSPTTDEIINAFETAFRVSGAGRLGKVLDLIQTASTVQVPTSNPTPTPTPPSPVSPGESGESPSTNTGA